MSRKNKNLLIKSAFFYILLFLLSLVVFFASACEQLSSWYGNLNKGNSEVTAAVSSTGLKEHDQKDTRAVDAATAPGLQENIPETDEQTVVLPQYIYQIIDQQSEAMLPEEVRALEGLLSIPFYEIELDLDFENAEYKGNAKVYYTNLEDTGLNEIYFRLFPNSGNVYGNGSLSIINLGINGRASKEFDLPDESILKIKLPHTLLPGEQVTIDLNFTGKVPEEFSEGSYGFFNKTGNTISLSGWFPILAVFDSYGWNLDPSSKIGDSVYSDMAFFKVRVNADNDLKAASTGIQVENPASGQQMASYMFVSGPSRDFVFVFSKDYKLISRDNGGIKFNCYYFNSDNNKASTSLATAIKAFEIFENKFGIYPFKEFDIVELPLKSIQGVEFPQLVLINSTVFGDKNVIVHEAAHQWWYNLVGSDAIDDPWMDEALATFSQVIYFEEAAGSEYAQGIMDYFMKIYDNKVAAGEDDFVYKGLDYFEEKGSRHYSAIVYVKGAVFFNELRRSIGDEDFFRALKAYSESTRYRIAVPGDMLDAFEKSAGKDLGIFYDKWLYSIQE